LFHAHAQAADYIASNKINAHQHMKIVKIKVFVQFRPSSMSTENLE